MNISFICTVLNEEKTITPFLQSLLAQSQLPDEVIIVDGGSADNTFEKMKEFKVKMKKFGIKFITLKKNNLNRSEGRNLAISKSKGEIIAVSDAGCLLNNNWLKEITKPFVLPDSTEKVGENGPIAVAAGYYLPTGNSLLQKILGQLTSVSLAKINPKDYLPSSRSVAFKKFAWEKVGGYPEDLKYNEDLIFAQSLKEKKIKFEFCPEAIVYWEQRKTISGALKQFFAYSVGDGMARERGPHFNKLKKRLIFLLVLICFSLLISFKTAIILCVIFLFYKSAKISLHLKSLSAFWGSILILPFIYFAVISGFIYGWLKNDK